METTAIIVSFNRPRYTVDCIKSLHKHFPKVKILVAENGNPDKTVKRVTKQLGGKYVEFPFDSGVPYVRNRCFEMVDTKYVLIGDDDFYYTARANIEKMEKFLNAHEEYAIIGGRVYEKGRVWDWQGYLHQTDSETTFEKIPADQLKYEYCNDSRLLYCQVDMMTNYWLGRLKDLIPYEEDQKVVHEHTDYMTRLKGKVNMAFSPDIVVDHKRMKYRYPAYKQYRFRKEEKDYLEKKYGWKR